MRREAGLVLLLLMAALVGIVEGGCKCHEPPPKQYDRAGREIVFQAHGKRIPGGDYRHTCGGCVADHAARVLRCAECMDDAHDLVVPAPVSLDRCVRYHNRNGVLECMPGEEYHGAGGVPDDDSTEAALAADEARRRRKRERLQRTMEQELMPAGSFRDTCADCRVVAEAGVDVVLLMCARCRVAPDSPETVRAMLMVQDCLEVENHHGTLVCVTPRSSNSGGSGSHEEAPKEGAHSEL